MADLTSLLRHSQQDESMMFESNHALLQVPQVSRDSRCRASLNISALLKSASLNCWALGEKSESPSVVRLLVLLKVVDATDDVEDTEEVRLRPRVAARRADQSSDVREGGFKQ